MPKVAPALMMVVGFLLLGACRLPAPALAEVRTATGMNVQRGDRGEAARPVLDAFTVRYDTVGDLQINLTFFEPLAEPAGLGGWEVAIYLADNVGADEAPFCVPLLSPDNFLITFSLGSAEPAEVAQYGTALYRLKWTVSPDRRSVELRSVDARLANRRLVCANADLNGPTDGQYSFIGASLFSGFGPLDGNLATTGRWHLASQIARLNNRLGGARRDPPLGAFPRCRRTGPTGVHCSARSRLRDVRGRPTISLRGPMTVSYTGDLRTRWRHDVKATLRWRRCPRSVSRTRARRRCSLTRRWRRGELGRVFRRVRASTLAPAGGSRMRQVFGQALDLPPAG